jgi:enamine deaminase RidA (YjgF/YER057c/UK114 family)
LARDVLWVGGHFGTRPDGTLHAGRCGEDITADAARAAARSAAINLLATIRDALGSLNRVEQVVRVYGVVNAMPQFVEHTSVIDAASDVLVEVFGEAGCHSRLAVGVSSLPANLTLEIEAQILVKGS